MLNLALLQLTSVDDVDGNQEQILNLLEAVVRSGKSVDLVSLPENALYLRIREGEEIPGIQLNHSAIAGLARWSQTHGTAMHIGSVALREPSGGLTNATLWIDAQGRVSVPYRKIHLFDVDVAGLKPIRESDVFAAGVEPSVIDFNGWKIGLSICYDLRFANLYNSYALLGVDLIMVPSAFLVKTGQAHWHTLLRARAIESQCYVVAAAQAGEHRNAVGLSRTTYGHSLVVAPWGEVMAEAQSSGPEVVFATLDKAEIDKVRKQIPMASHRRHLPKI